MSSRSALASIAIASVLTTGSVFTTSAVMAAPDGPAAEAATSQAGKNALNRAAEKASQAMFEVRASRVAIFNGFLEESLELANLASENLEAAQLALQVYRRVEGQGALADLRRDWVPFDTAVVEYVDIDSDRQTLQALDTASTYLEQGKTASAAEALSEAGVDASITTAYLPVGNGLELLEEARSLIGDEQYQQANMVLKSVEDASRRDNYTIIQKPLENGDGS